MENNNLAFQNYETLKDELSKILKSNDQLKQQLKTVVEELNQIKQERQEKEIRKQARANRKRLPKRDPMTAEIYKEVIKAAEGPTYINLRTRIALCILAVTGVRINELLPLKGSQLETLFKENWIAIDRSKRGPSNHKAFLTKEGKKIIHDRQILLAIAFASAILPSCGKIPKILSLLSKPWGIEN